MQVYVALFALVAVANAGVVSYAAVIPGLAHTGTSVQHRSQDTLGNYAFGYNEGHIGGGTFRKEVGDAFGNKAGSYGLTGADGRIRTVNYVADAAGFRADIKSNEPGVGATLQDPAHTVINKALIAAPAAAVATYAAAPAVVAPVAHHVGLSHYAAAPAVAAPVAHHVGLSHYAAAPAVVAPVAHHVGLSHYAAAPVAKVAHHAALSHYAAAPVAHHYANHLGLSHYAAGYGLYGAGLTHQAYY